MDRAGTEGKLWLDEQSGVDPFVCHGLFESADVSTERWISEGRPRCIVFEDGVIINLRGANLNPGAVQRRALESLMTAQVSWLGENDRTLLLDLIQDITKHVEDLDGVRERAIIIQDEISNQLSEQMNRTMFQLSLIAATFLPLGFLTGLLSMNLAGVPIPGASAPWAFWIVCTLLFVVGGVAVLVFRRLKWL